MDQKAEMSYNALVLDAVRSMPSGGGYDTSKATDAIRQRAVTVRGDRLVVDASRAKPSYCSGGTYLVFLKVVERLRSDGNIELSPAALQELAVADAKDGVGVWGRWNANGPGTAKFFADARVGQNFTSLDEAQPGDFLKIFWTEEIGRRERGHSVVYLGHRKGPSGETVIDYWSSNESAGYGRGSATLSRCKHLLFSRLIAPERLEGVTRLPDKDAFLASMLRVDSSRGEILRLTSAR